MNDLKIFAKTIEPEAISQIELLLAQKPFKDCKVRIMPDVHAGKGCVIGFTANLGDKVIPNIVGVDIGCGMLTVSLGKINIDYSKLDQVIREKVPAGMNVHKDFVPFNCIETLVCYKQLKNIDWIHASVGTLGGGNHFIEVDEANDGTKYLVIHTGSRNLGKQVAEIYQDLAIKQTNSCTDEINAIISKLRLEGREREISEAIAEIKKKNPKTPHDLCYIKDEYRDAYLHDMKICQTFAALNREKIAKAIMDAMGYWKERSFHTVHNYIDNSGMVRKGAIAAHMGQPVLIPMNMRDGCIIGEGLGNEDWNYSAPHGAGRIMSRTKARSEISLQEFKNTMEGIFTTSVCVETLDEAPQAYKPVTEIMDCIKDTVKVIEIIKPVYNFKASELNKR